MQILGFLEGEHGEVHRILVVLHGRQEVLQIGWRLAIEETGEDLHEHGVGAFLLQAHSPLTERTSTLLLAKIMSFVRKRI